MIEDIRTLTAQLAEEPDSLAFLELGETLRRRGQLDAALKIARGGVSRYPGLADAHDLLARVLCDRDDLPAAFEAWADALRADPMHPAALKGISFLYFRAGDPAAARLYLERALETDPDDVTIPAALARLDTVPPSQAPILEQAPAGETDVASDAPPADGAGTPSLLQMSGMLLVDANGMRLSGALPARDGRDCADAVAAELAGVSKEAARTARLLSLGSWDSITVEAPDGHFVLVTPTDDTLLLAVRGADMPMARLGLLADRAAREARAWLEQER